jgi:type I restriction enzyme, S subunit
MIGNDKVKPLPTGWRWTRIGDICEVQTGGTPDTENPEYYNGDIPWVRSGDIKGQYIHDIPTCISERGLLNSNAVVYPPGTVLIAMCGQGKTRGTSGILTVPAACSQSVAALLPNDTAAPEVLYFALFWLYDDIRRINGKNQRTNLNLGTIRNIQIPLPPEPHADEIAAKLTQKMLIAESIRSAAERQLQAALALPKALLNEVFNGSDNHRCKNDEHEIALQTVSAGLPVRQP